MSLSDLIRPDAVVHRIRARTRDAAIDEIGAALARLPPVIDAADVQSALRDRERLGTTAVGDGVALPHTRVPGVPSTRGLIALSEHGIDFGSPDGAPVRILVAVVSPPQAGGVQLQALGAVSRRLADASIRARLLAARGAREVYDLLVGPEPSSSASTGEGGPPP
ncbi:PTS sugar transporter subunit IIA [Myxococcota bacterium]|nr:PTS sugar transporter subunit IIA [Myxococcota bacterium]